MSCTKKVKQTCGTKMYAPCVYYEKTIPDFSPLSDEDCITIEETTEDLYNQIEIIKNDLDLSDLGQACLQYVPSPQQAKVKDVLLKYEEEICNLKEQVEILQSTDICNKNITQCGIDLSGISDQCNNPITTLGEILQYIVTNLNN